jgi:RNA polymerase sigma-70 factor (ECF subfamily)
MDDVFMEPMDDIQRVKLIQAASQGDRTAFGELVKHHESMLLSFALYRLPAREEAVEAVQDSFIRAYQQLADFRQDADFGTWLRSICRFMILTRAKKYVREKRKSENAKEQLMALAVERIESTVAQEPEHDLSEYLRDCTAALSEQNQSLLHDRYALEHSTHQISEKTGRTTTWVTSTLHRVRSALRTCIENRMKESNHE